MWTTKGSMGDGKRSRDERPLAVRAPRRVGAPSWAGAGARRLSPDHRRR
jgi:hypothetical protein